MSHFKLITSQITFEQTIFFHSKLFTILHFSKVNLLTFLSCKLSNEMPIIYLLDTCHVSKKNVMASCRSLTETKTFFFKYQYQKQTRAYFFSLKRMI